eukprot:1559750-Rhodomonas_salina.1
MAARHGSANMLAMLTMLSWVCQESALETIQTPAELARFDWCARWSGASDLELDGDRREITRRAERCTLAGPSCVLVWARQRGHEIQWSGQFGPELRVRECESLSRRDCQRLSVLEQRGEELAPALSDDAGHLHGTAATSWICADRKGALQWEGAHMIRSRANERERRGGLGEVLQIRGGSAAQVQEEPPPAAAMESSKKTAESQNLMTDESARTDASG